MAKYQIDVRLYGTLYIEAEDAVHARSIAEETAMSTVFIRDGGETEGVEWSEVATCHGPDEGDEAEECE